MNNISDEQRAAMIGEVILSARKVEAKLHSACGDTEVAGIHALTELLGSRLPDDLKRQLHYIATVRNTAAHEEGFVQTDEEFQRYTQNCQAALDTLNRLFPTESVQIEKNSGASETPENSLDLEVEKEAFAEIFRKLAKLGYFPLLGNIFLLYLFLYTVLRGGVMLLLGSLYGCSVVLGIKGWQSTADHGLLYVAGGAMFFAYIVTALLSIYSPVEKLPKIIGWLPGLNIIYLIIRYLRELAWSKFLASFSGLSLLAGCIILLMKAHYNYAAGLLLINYLVSLCAALFWGKQSEK